MDYQKLITGQFRSTSNRSPKVGDTAHFDGMVWEFNGKEWWTSPVNKILESKDFHIRSLEAMLKKACKFKISPKKKHDITIEREKEKDKPFYYIIKNGFNNRITKHFKSEYEPVKTQITDRYREMTEFVTLVDAFAVAEKYVDMKEEDAD